MAAGHLGPWSVGTIVRLAKESMRTTEQQGTMNRGPRQSAFQVTRIVAAALAIAVGTLWGVAWVLTDGGALGIDPDSISESTALAVWAAVALPAFAVALYLRSRAASASEVRPPLGNRPSPAEQRRAQASAIVAHALLEGPALLGGVFFLLIGTSAVVPVALPVYVLGLMLTWPQREWFGEDIPEHPAGSA